MKPPSAMVSMPFARSCSSRSVPGNALRPFLPLTRTSPASGFIASQIAEFQVFSVKRLPSRHPARMPRFGFGLSDWSAAKLIGAWKTWTPAARMCLARREALSSMPVAFMLSLTPSCSLPPSVQNSFWNSMKRTAVFFGSTSTPPLPGRWARNTSLFLAGATAEDQKAAFEGTRANLGCPPLPVCLRAPQLGRDAAAALRAARLLRVIRPAIFRPSQVARGSASAA
mmetsp:Transcript_25355/g.64470  ORF Transcript_25355/g.64470 Transcript_25355/m.64470 type:complete len:226 (+) Transcript_25355:553-1230(+)